jgi:adenylosuccinate lyase
VPALENVTLWHERDISHSSVERVIAPDATIALHFALDRLSGLIETLLVYPEAMRANLERLGGLVHSQGVLLALTQAGMGREDAYAAVQAAAMKAWAGDGDFLGLLEADPAIAEHLNAADLAACFDPTIHTRHVDTIFKRVFGEE